MILAILLAALLAAPLPSTETTITIAARGPHQPFRPIDYTAQDYYVAGTVARQPVVTSVRVTLLDVTRLESFYFSHATTDSPATLSVQKQYGCYFSFGPVCAFYGSWSADDYTIPPASFLAVNAATPMTTAFYSGPGIEYPVYPFACEVVPMGTSHTFTDPETCAYFTGTGRAPIYGSVQGWGVPMAHYAQSTYGGYHTLVAPFWDDGLAFTGLTSHAKIEVFP